MLGPTMAVSRLLNWIIETLLIAGFVAMLALIFGNVVLRYGFDSGILMAEEVSRVLFVWLTFGGAYLVAQEGGHLGMSAITGALGAKGRLACGLVAESLSFLCMMLVIIGCWRQVVINIDNHAPITGLPLAVTYMAGLACGLGIAALNLLALWRLLTGRNRTDPPDSGHETISGAAG
jgi:TRAP-type C4-dicarboxylate transport system permease small subunit